MKKKILFLTASMGGGHNSAVRAVSEAIEKYHPGKFDIKVIDVISLVGPNIEKFAAQFYEKSAKYSQFTWKAFFELTDRTEIISKLDKRGYQLIKKSLEPIALESPDVIVSCYPFLNYSISRLLAEKHEKAPFINVITDTGEVHTAWLCERADYYIAPTDETGYFLESRGVHKEKIKSFGFTVAQDFYKKHNIPKIKAKYGIKDHHKVVLYFTGHFGLGKTVKKVQTIDETVDNVTMIVVCGNNKKMPEKLRKLKYRNNVKVYGFVDNVAELMNIATVVITKAGGLSVMEAVTMKLPTIVTEIIPGQEEPNARFIETMGFGYVEEEPAGLAYRLKYILETDHQRIKNNLINYHKNEGSDKQIADFVALTAKKKEDSHPHILAGIFKKS